MDDSLSTLTELKKLYIGDDYNHHFGTSLNNLYKLESIRLGKNYLQDLNGVFDNLVNLKTIRLFENTYLLNKEYLDRFIENRNKTRITTVIKLKYI